MRKREGRDGERTLTPMSEVVERENERAKREKERGDDQKWERGGAAGWMMSASADRSVYVVYRITCWFPVTMAAVAQERKELISIYGCVATSQTHRLPSRAFPALAQRCAITAEEIDTQRRNRRVRRRKMQCKQVNWRIVAE